MTFGSIILHRHFYHHLGTMNTYDFAGNSTTFVGAIALFVTPVLMYWIFRSYWNIPYRK